MKQIKVVESNNMSQLDIIYFFLLVILTNTLYDIEYINLL